MEELLVVSKCICLAFPSEEHYEQCMKDAGAFRQFLTTMYSQYPELFPRQMSQGFKFHSFTPFPANRKAFGCDALSYLTEMSTRFVPTS